MSGCKVIAVFGATGNQGGAVLRALASSSQFSLRGITRNPESAETQKLLSSLPKSSAVEFVRADVSDAASVEKALTGAWGVFMVTTYNPREKNTEEEQAKLVADVAIKAGVKFFTFSSLSNAKIISSGQHRVSHFTAKNLAEQYIRSLPFADGAAFAYPGFFASNFLGQMKPRKSAKDGAYEFMGLFRNDVALPITDIEEEFAQTVKQIFTTPEKYNKQSLLTGTYLTMPQLADTFTKALGLATPARYVQLPAAAGKNFPEEMLDMVQFFNNFGYYGGAAINNIAQPTDITAFWKRHAQQF